MVGGPRRRLRQAFLRRRDHVGQRIVIDLTETTAAEAVGRNFLDFLPPGSTTVAMALLEALRQNEEVGAEPVVLPRSAS